MSPRPDREPTTTDLMDNLVMASFRVMALLSQAAAAHDLSLTQMRALAILRDRQPKMAELAGFLGLDRSSVSGLVDRAVARGLVQRASSPDDGRAVRIGLTAQGRTLARTVSGEVAELIAPMLGRLGAVDQKRLTGLLERLLAEPN